MSNDKDPQDDPNKVIGAMTQEVNRQHMAKGEHVLVKLHIGEAVAMFNPHKRQAVQRLFDTGGITGLVIFLNDIEGSLHRGTISAVKVGPDEKVRTFEECLGKYIGNDQAAMYYVPKS